jgi:hypothetical protein
LIQTGNRRFLILLFFGACLPAFGADPEVKAGGIMLTLPAPASDFADAGDRLRTTVFELLVPATNRLLSAYIPVVQLAEVSAGKAPGGLEVYAMVEVPRQAEYNECTPEFFAQFLKGLEPALGKLDLKTAGEMEAEINIHLKSLGSKSIEIGHSESLGSVFQKNNAAGFAMLAAYQQGDRTITMASGIAAIRVKQRLVLAYLFRKYESPDTVKWLRKTLEAWGDQILARN